MEMQQSQEMYKRSTSVAPGGVHSPVRSFKGVDGTPVFFEKADGAFLYSVDGKSYIDFCQSFGPLILGHRDRDVSASVHTMIDTAWSFGACEPYSLALAELITSKVHWAEKIRFVSSGTEAVMSALRVARAATKRNKILKFDGCYDGHVDSLLVKAGSGLAGESSSDSAGVTGFQTQDTLVAPLDSEEAVDEIFRVHGSEIAAVIIEPLPANFGLLPQRKEFLWHLAETTRKHGALLIFDEVISGFRVAFGGMAETLGIIPDLVTYGKVIGGGFPVGAYAGKKDLMDLVAPLGPVYQAGTLSANPVGMAAGLATLQKCLSANVYDVLQKRTAQFCWQLNKIFIDAGLSLGVSHTASIFWIHSQPHKAPLRAIHQMVPEHRENFKKLFWSLLGQGVYLAPSAFEVGFISLSHTEEILDETLVRFRAAAREL